MKELKSPAVTAAKSALPKSVSFATASASAAPLPYQQKQQQQQSKKAPVVEEEEEELEEVYEEEDVIVSGSHLAGLYGEMDYDDEYGGDEYY